MESFSRWSKINPAFIVFLIDQSASMQNVSLGGGNRAEIAARNIQNAIADIICMCIHGEEIIDRAFITVIGYGQENHSATMIRQGWVSEWADDVITAKQYNTCIIPAVAEWGANMNDGFRFTIDIIKEWLSIREELNGEDDRIGVAPIIVVNITKGTTMNEQETCEAAQELMSMKNTYLFNIIIPHEVCNTIEIVFPSLKQTVADIREPNCPEWLYDISSKLPKDSVYLAKSIGIEDITEDSRGIIVSYKDNCAMNVFRLFPR